VAFAQQLGPIPAPELVKLLGLLAKDPSKRLQSCREISRELRRILR